ncbi:MAG TPA: phage tail sheath subtilisin-like domain-containing protein [Haliangium sp.]|nr:phage tail sheath subtilisin-like domain-containing protein [Haliangium sp.]
MPTQPTYPGVYIEEIPSGVRTLTGVATSVTAFIGRAQRGPVNDPVLISSFAEFERTFGGLWVDSDMSYAVRDFFLNGGGQALIVRVFSKNVPTFPIDGQATVTLPPSGTESGPTLVAAYPGEWGNSLVAFVDHDTADDETPEAAEYFNLTLVDLKTGNEEKFRNVLVGNLDDNSNRAKHPRYLRAVLENQSNLARMQPGNAVHPSENTQDADGNAIPVHFELGDDGKVLTAANLEGNSGGKEGLYALEKADIFNLLCIPDSLTLTGGAALTEAAIAYCEKRRAVMLIDSPDAWTVTTIKGEMDGKFPSTNAAIYFPRMLQPDPLRDNQIVSRPPCGAVAGVIARTDGARGIWKAPAGLDAYVNGAPRLSIPLTDFEIGQLNPIGINCLKTMPGAGRVVWGARTRRGDDRLSSEWKYIPIRRLALYIEESLYRGTQWVVFEPNDEPLWAQIRLNVGSFMNDLFRKGAFFGSSPADAYFVKCDKESTTQSDINLGIVNIVVGFAPLKPAEFVIIKLQQMAGQLAA